MFAKFRRTTNIFGILWNFAKMQFRPWRLITESEKVTADVCRAMRQGSAFRNFSPSLHASSQFALLYRTQLRGTAGRLGRPSDRWGWHDGNLAVVLPEDAVARWLDSRSFFTSWTLLDESPNFKVQIQIPKSSNLQSY